MASEFDLIARYFTRPTPQAVLGVGDDAALMRLGPGMELAVSTDMLVEGTHFLPYTDAEALGWKSLAVNLSDLAAMGAQARWAVLSVALPNADEAWIAAFCRGLFACADTYGVDLVGGDTTRGPLTLCPTIFGEVPAGQALLRSGARPGDEVWISGSPGLAALGLAHLQGRTVLPEPALAACVDKLQRPQPRVALGLGLRGLASAAIDVSDGLLGDLRHILERSRVGAVLHLERMPTAAREATPDADLARASLLAGGDDYELLFTAAPDKHAAIRTLGATLGLPLQAIGAILADAAAGLELLAQGKPVPFAQPMGFDHFTAQNHG